ncbi:hypothetical protein NDU88_002012 [Pleurodeles waltl]|uniref:Interleukin-7 n=1 Tax=Pleurodeles waltl TaxID=8319 RepID=A0AAV7UVQ4_PLEWA|nr:hypothetical protein NDU88_002012 [Pleurodeles waltl]
MLNAFFRYVFGIPPLMLVLLPVGSPTREQNNMGDIYKRYDNVLSPRLGKVTEYEFRNQTCCKKEEPEELRKYLCNDTMEINSLCHMGCALRKLADDTKMNQDIKCNLIRLSFETEELLSCRCVNEVKLSERKCKAKKRSVDKCNQKICVLKKMIDSFKSCWDQLRQDSQR